MKNIRALFAAFGGLSKEERDRLEQLAEVNRGLRREVRELREALRDLTRVAATVERQADRLAIVQGEDVDVNGRLAEFRMLFDVDAISAHARRAIADAAVTGTPPERLDVPRLWPDQVATALVQAVPAALFFDEHDGSLMLDLPPRLAPVAATIAWQFVIEQLVKPVLAPALLDRMRLPYAEFDVSGIQLRLSDNGSQDAGLDSAGSDVAVTVSLDSGAAACVRLPEYAGRGHSPASGATLRFQITPR